MQDYLNSKADLLIVKQSQATYAEALRQAKAAVQTVTDELAKAKAERETQSSDSAQSSTEQQAKVETLTQQLAVSQNTLTEAQRIYDSKMAEYQAVVKKAEIRARRLENENVVLKWIAGILAALAIGASVWAAVK